MTADSLTMNNLRASYIKFLPIVFLGALLSVFVQVYHDSVYDRYGGQNQLWYLSALLAIAKFVPLWIAVGLAFKQKKAANISLGIALLLVALEYFLFRIDAVSPSGLFHDLWPLVGNVTFLPGLIFGYLCFNKRGLRYFLPLWLLAYAINLCYIGSCYLEASPYNAWYKLLRIEKLAEVRTGEHTYRVLKFLYYTFSLVVPSLMFIMYSECYTAAANNKKLKDLFRVDLFNTYSKAGATTLFIILRLLINMLVVGFILYPLLFFFKTGYLNFDGQSIFTFFITAIAGLALLVVIVLYYRKFLVEYFIANRQKIQWLFWIVNIPIIGLLIFPFVVLAQRAPSSAEERTHFFYDDALYNSNPYGVMGVMLGLSLLSMLVLRSVEHFSDILWLWWLIEIALFIWYVAAISGYYVLLGLGVTGFVIYFISMTMEAYSKKPGINVYRGPQFMEALSFWYIAAFGFIQYVILLPVFHLHYTKVVQEPPPYMEENEDIGIPDPHH